MLWTWSCGHCNLYQLRVKHWLWADPYKIPFVCSMQHWSQDAASYLAIKKKKKELKAAGRSGICQGNRKRSWGYNQCLKQDFHLLKLLSEIKREKKKNKNKLLTGIRKIICVNFRTDQCLKKQFKHALCLCSVWTPIYHVTRITFWLLFLACAALQLGKVFFFLLLFFF